MAFLEPWSVVGLFLGGTVFGFLLGWLAGRGLAVRR